MDPPKPPPTYLKDVYKNYTEYEEPGPDSPQNGHSKWHSPEKISQDHLKVDVLNDFLRSQISIASLQPETQELSAYDLDALKNARSITSKIMPGIIVLKNCIPPLAQRALIQRMLERDLNNQEHMTNLHLHYDITYPEGDKTFFDFKKTDIVFSAKDPLVHKNLSIERVLKKKLRWITLGGQYDWTNKRYPDEIPPPFPSDIGDLVRGLVPSTEPQAAIINFYTPGDTLSLHRDVSEQVNKPLISISLGCDAIFVIGQDMPGVESSQQSHVMKLSSGDVVVMKDDARYFWHGVPKIVPGTSPSYLQNCPPGHPGWENYMDNRRLNINIRQMF